MKTNLKLISTPFLALLFLFALFFLLAKEGIANDQKIAQSMAKTANELISAYKADKETNLIYQFENSSREEWHFFPNWSGRTGISLNNLSSGQQENVKELLTLLLSSDALLQQEDIRLIHGLKKIGIHRTIPGTFILSRSLERLQLNPPGVGASKDIISL